MNVEHGSFQPIISLNVLTILGRQIEKKKIKL